MRSAPPRVLVLGCAVWKELGGGRGTVDGRVVAACVEDAQMVAARSWDEKR